MIWHFAFDFFPRGRFGTSASAANKALLSFTLAVRRGFLEAGVASIPIVSPRPWLGISAASSLTWLGVLHDGKLFIAQSLDGAGRRAARGVTEEA